MDLRERRPQGTVRHPWERARAAFFLDVLADHRVFPRAVLDVGAGDAYVAERLRALRPAAAVTLVDDGYSDAEIAALGARGFRAVRSVDDVDERCAFDLVLLLDVVEHLDDPAAALARILARAAPGARVLFSVPAIAALWSSHDAALLHRRRYGAREARRLLEDAGLAIVECGGLFHSLTLPRAAAVLRERFAGAGGAGGGVGAWRFGEAAADVVARVLRAEQRLVARGLSKRGVDVPGLSWWALAERA